MAVRIYTDGGCSGNPGPGGWAFVVLRDDEKIAEKRGGEDLTTNNRMELAAVIAALTALSSLRKRGKAPENAVTLLTDSQYVQKGESEWILKWRVNGWRNSEKKPVANADLWQKLDALVAALKSEGLKITWRWVKGHAGNEWNERCDALTQRAIEEIVVKNESSSGQARG